MGQLWPVKILNQPTGILTESQSENSSISFINHLLLLLLSNFKTQLWLIIQEVYPPKV